MKCKEMAMHCEICPQYHKCWIDNINPYNYEEENLIILDKDYDGCDNKLCQYNHNCSCTIGKEPIGCGMEP